MLLYAVQWHSERGRTNIELPYSGISGFSVSIPIPNPFLYEFRYRIPIPNFPVFSVLFGSVSASITGPRSNYSDQHPPTERPILSTRVLVET